MNLNQKNKTGKPPLIKFHDFWEMDDEQVASSYRKLKEKIELSSTQATSQPGINWWRGIAVAASAALLVVAGLYWHFRPDTVQIVEAVYVTNNPSQVALSDGTKVWLSAQSQLRYQETFTGKNRAVTLDGEAYFEVAPDKEHPFLVLAGGQTVEVTGTSFNVRAYSDELNVTTALVEGSVKVTGSHHESATLKPGQQSVCDKQTGALTVGNANIELLMSWKTGKYIFENQTFEDIAHILEKGFDVTIRIENEKLKAKPYTMRFENGESLEKILDLIKVNARYTYQYENGIIVIK